MTESRTMYFVSKLHDMWCRGILDDNDYIVFMKLVLDKADWIGGGAE